METKRISTLRRRDVAAMVLGLAASGAAFAWVASWIHVPAGRMEAAARRESAGRAVDTPGLVISRADRLSARSGLREQLWLLDPSPLYMPDAEAIGPSVLLERPGGRAAEMFAPALLYPENRPAAAILRPAGPGAPEVAAAGLASARWFEGMSREGEVLGRGPVSAIRAARISIYREGEDVKAEAEADLVADEVLSKAEWRPVQLMVVINTIGVVARPVLVDSSGDERADDRIRDAISRNFLARQNLSPGIYRIEVGP